MRSRCRCAPRPHDPILHDCDYATEDGDYAADRGTLVVPEKSAQGRLAADRAAGRRIARLSGGSCRADLSPPGRSRNHEHDLPDGEPVRRQARRRAGRLPRRRGLGEARLPRGDLGSRAGSRLSHREGDAADAAAIKDCAERLQDAGFDLAGYTLPQRVDDLDAARKALVRARRPPQRERRRGRRRSTPGGIRSAFTAR